MSVEGMWQFQSASFEDPENLVWGGIVILESGRVFGGDSVMAYHGSYEVDRGVIIADVRCWTWNTEIPEEQMANVFGMTGPIDYQVRLEGSHDGNKIEGAIWPVADPSLKLVAAMKKIADLP